VASDVTVEAAAFVEGQLFQMKKIDDRYGNS